MTTFLFSVHTAGEMYAHWYLKMNLPLHKSRLLFYLSLALIFLTSAVKTVKYVHGSNGTQNQESLCWRGPAAILQPASQK
jgi:hypothetical protein